MTENETKKYMLIEKECINRDCDRDCANCDIVQNVEDLNNAYNIAINALEKQIPKKVNLRHIRKYDGYDDGECPNCGMSVSRECDGNDVFCPDCGQKLDWSDGE